MTKIHVIDLNFKNAQEAIAAYVIESDTGLILIETGPESTFDKLAAGIRSFGFEVQDVKHVLLTHIHFDHAGAAWRLAELEATIYVHPIGAPHLESPEKLYNSAAKIYGDEMQEIWGIMKSIPKEKLKPVDHMEKLKLGNLEFQALHTPGHAVHHIAWKFGDIIFTGDVAGVKIANGPVVPPCPPPDINIEAWLQSIDLLQSQNPSMLYLTHFGKIQEIDNHFSGLKAILADWAAWIKPYFDQDADQKEVIPEFMKHTQKQLLEAGCDSHLVKVYEYANPSWMSVAGLFRYWKLKSQGRL